MMDSILQNKLDKRNFFYSFFSVIVFPFVILIGFWFLLSLKTNSSLILPSPKDVFASLLLLCKTNEFYLSIGLSILRTFIAFAISVGISLILGILCGMFPIIWNILKMPMSIVKTTPVVSFILLAIFWFPTSFVPTFVAVLMAFPIITTNIYTGIKNTDNNLLSMAKVYKVSKRSIIKNIYVPSVLPYFSSSLVTSFSITWKVVVASEVLCLPRHSSGTLMYTAKVHLETETVFAITIVIILLSFVCELILSGILKRVKNG